MPGHGDSASHEGSQEAFLQLHTNIFTTLIATPASFTE